MNVSYHQSPAATLPDCLPDVLWPKCALLKNKQTNKKGLLSQCTILKAILEWWIRDSNSSSIYMDQSHHKGCDNLQVLQWCVWLRNILHHRKEYSAKSVTSYSLKTDFIPCKIQQLKNQTNKYNYSWIFGSCYGKVSINHGFSGIWRMQFMNNYRDNWDRVQLRVNVLHLLTFRGEVAESP